MSKKHLDIGNKPPTDQNGNIVTVGIHRTLPPGVISSAQFGHLFVEMGDLKWLTYDGVNYLEDYGAGPKLRDLYANFKFWGEDPSSKGIYLKFKNGMKPKKETAANKYKYVVNCPEPSFEKYLDDMGALVVDFYSVQEGLTIGTSKIIVKLFIKRRKQPGDMAPLLELRGTFPITLTMNNDVKIGEFSIAITSSFGSKTQQIPSSIQNNQNQNREMIDLNEDSFLLNEQQAKDSVQKQNQMLHDQMNPDDRIASSLANQRAAHDQYNSGAFNLDHQERPTRGPSSNPTGATQFQNSNNLTGKNLKDSNFGQRQQIVIDENDDTIQGQNELEDILARGERLRKQMADAIDPTTSAWEQIHGIHHVPKTYVPPFMKDEFAAMNAQAAQPTDRSPGKLRDKMYEVELEEEAANPNEESLIQINPRTAKIGDPSQPHLLNPDADQQQNLEKFAEQEANKRQIKDMRFIRVKVKNVVIDDPALLPKLIDQSFDLQVSIPLPDIYQKKISDQHIHLSNYEVMGHNEFAFNSLSLYNFRVDEETLGAFVSSQIHVMIPDHQVDSRLSMNRLIMSHDFKLETAVELTQTYEVVKKVQGENKNKKPQEVKEQHERRVGSVVIEMNLQKGDTEDEMRRNYQLKMQQEQEEKARLEAEQEAETRKKMQFVMEQSPVFGQLYLHIEKLGHNDNLGARTEAQALAAAEAAEEEAARAGGNIQVRESNTDGLGSTLNNRATDSAAEEVKIAGSGPEGSSLERAPESSQKKLTLPKRNFFVQFKAFPNLEKLKTSTVWQQDEDADFRYRSQFPVLMCPDSLEKMEKFVFVLELWDQISPSVQEFIGLVKIPLAPICYSMKTTDDEIYSLNFMADQFCLYPMIISDGYLPIYSPKLGQDVGHLKVTLAMGSPIQVNRLIQKEQEEERRIAAEKEKEKIREAEALREKELKAARRAKKEKKRQLEEERLKRQAEAQEQEANGGLGSLFGGAGAMTKTQAGKGSPAKMMPQNIAQLLRQSLNSNMSADYDQRKQNMLNCLRKLFEEARASGIEELNGEAIFKDEMKNFDGTVQKEEVIYSLLNNQQFSLTRVEVAQIVQLMLDINRDDGGKVDVDELHFSYRSYIKYYELIEQRIIDMLEKFKISIVKKLELQDLVLELAADIESKADDSKMAIIELREILEDRNGIQIRDALYDQFMQFFDLDRDQQVYITSLCEYLKLPSSQKINFFKVNTNIITNQISEFIANSIETQPDCLQKLEDEFKKELWKNHALKKQMEKEEERNPTGADPDIVPHDLLAREQVNAKLFQYKLKRQGIALSIWEVFTLFEHLNTKNSKMFFEPQRYHQVMFGTFYQFITNQEYDDKLRNIKPGKKRGHSRSGSRTNSRPPTAGERRGSRGPRAASPTEESDSEEEMDESKKPYKQVKHVFEIKVKELKNIPVLNKFICSTNNQIDNGQPSSNYNDPRYQKQAKAQANKYIQNVAVKYSFPLDEDEILESDYLQLNKEALDQQGLYNYKVSMDTVHTYVIGKDDNIQRVLELCQSRGNNNITSGLADPYSDNKMMNSNQARREELFNMSIALYQDNREYIIGNSHLPIEDLIDTITQFETKRGTFDRKTQKSSLNRTLFLYGTTYSQRENCIIGKLQLELQYSQEKLFLSKQEAKLYKEQSKDKKGLDQLSANPYSCFMHRETYINRKIPLNAKLSVLIDRVSNLKESIENIEHFAKIQHAALGMDFGQSEFVDPYSQDFSKNLSMSTMVQNRQDLQHLDRRRVLKHILKNGLNLIVRCSVFEEDQELSQKYDIREKERDDPAFQEKYGEHQSADFLKNFSKYQTRMLYNSLNPVFGEVFEMNLQMDTKIFEYLKNKRAIFEIRHYIVESQRQKVQKLRESGIDDFNMRKTDDDVLSQATVDDEQVLGQCDYIVLGHVRVPLLQLITKNNGVDGDFTIFDEFKQKMGSLKLRIALNHHNSQRPLYSTSNKIPNQVQDTLIKHNNKTTLIDKSIGLNTQVRMGTLRQEQMKRTKYILGLDFVELILKGRKELVKHVQGQTQRFFLKFRLFNQNYQTKFIGGDETGSLRPLNILLNKINLQQFDIGKSTFLELDMLDQTEVETAFGKPVEIQLWHKIESLKSYERPIKEEMLGQFHIELNELSKITNRRLKAEQVAAQPGKFQVYEGYFCMHECKRDVLSSDRLGMRLYLFNKDETNETLKVEDMNQIFNQYRPAVEATLRTKLDPHAKGYVEVNDLVQAVKDQIPEEYLAQKLIWFIKTSLEYKSVDQVFYSPLFGLPPPFFKYSSRFDQLEIVCRFCQEFEGLDSSDNGFLPANLFRNALEGELKLKTKIVDDFIDSIRDISIENSNIQSNTATVKEMQSLDVNLITNSLKTSHIDYIILLRKLSQFMELNQGNNDARSLVHERILDNKRDHEAAQNVVLYFEVDNGMRLKNPLSQHEPPSTYVSMKPTFECKERGQFIQTNDIKQSAYPTWNFRSQNFTMPLNEFNRKWLEDGGNLEFEVFHKAVGASNNLNVQESSHLIGVAFVPLKALIEGKGKSRLTGLFDVVGKQNIYGQSIQSASSLKPYEASLGKIKVCVTANLNIRRLLENPDQAQTLAAPPSVQSSQVVPDPMQRASAQSDFLRNVSFGDKPTASQYFNNPYPSHPAREPTYQSIQSSINYASQALDQAKDRTETGPHHPQSFTNEQLDVEARVYHHSLQNATDDQLDQMHSSNLNDLDALTRKLKESMHVLDAKVGESPTIIPRRQIDEESLDSRDGVPQVNTQIPSQQPLGGSFGQARNDFIAGAHTTYKTDLQKATMTQQIQDFREEHLKKKKVVDNPFASQDALGHMVIPQTPAEDTEAVQQPLDEVESQTNTLNQTEEVKIEHSLRKREPSEAKTDSPAFGTGELEQEEARSRTKIDFDNVNYDEEEMKWLEKIVKKQ